MVAGLLALGAGPAMAGETACWFENGAVVVPAEVAGIAGDFLLDPTTAATQIHETRAQGAGIVATDLLAEARVAGLTTAALPVHVVDLDGRSPGFDTPIAGVIGADLLAGRVLEVSFAPCRVILTAGKGRQGPAGGLRLAVVNVDGVPAVRAAASDDRVARSGLFGIDFSSAGVARLSDRVAGVAKTEGYDPMARNGSGARVRAVSFGGRLYEEAPSGLIGGLDPALIGVVGTGLLSRWRVRLDLARDELVLLPHPHP